MQEAGRERMGREEGLGGKLRDRMTLNQKENTVVTFVTAPRSQF